MLGRESKLAFAVLIACVLDASAEVYCRLDFEDELTGVTAADLSYRPHSHIVVPNNDDVYCVVTDIPAEGRTLACGVPSLFGGLGNRCLNVKADWQDDGLRIGVSENEGGQIGSGVEQSSTGILCFDMMIRPTIADEQIPCIPKSTASSASAMSAGVSGYDGESTLRLRVMKRGLVCAVDDDIAVYSYMTEDESETNWVAIAGVWQDPSVVPQNMILRAADGGSLPPVGDGWHRLTFVRKLAPGAGTMGGGLCVYFEIYIDGIRVAAEGGTADFRAIESSSSMQAQSLRFVGLGLVDDVVISSDSPTFGPAPLPDGGPYTETVDGLEWTFWVTNGVAKIVGDYSIAGAIGAPHLGIRSALAAASGDVVKGQITLPKELGRMSVQFVGKGAFAYLDFVTSIIIPSTVTEIEDGAFCYCFGLEYIGVEMGNQHFCSVNGALYNAERTRLMAYPNAHQGPVWLMEPLETVAGLAFSGARSVSKIYFPSTLRTLGYESLYTANYMRCNVIGVTNVVFRSTPPVGFEESNLQYAENCEILYPADAAEAWTPIVSACNLRNAKAYDPVAPAVTGVGVGFIAAGGELSTNCMIFAPDGVYGALPTARRDGCTFAGWYADDGQQITPFSLVRREIGVVYARWVEDNVGLYAKWAPNSYSVSFHANGGSGTMLDQNLVYDNVGALAANAFLKSGYSFLGWALSPEGEIVYRNGTIVSNLTEEADAQIVLYAYWRREMPELTEDQLDDWVSYDLTDDFAEKHGMTSKEYRTAFRNRFGTDYSVAFTNLTGKMAADGTPLCVWHDYVAGTDPLDEASVFTAKISMDSTGEPQVTWTPDLKTGRKYTKWGKMSLSDASWKDVETLSADDAGRIRFYKVEVSIP